MQTRERHDLREAVRLLSAYPADAVLMCSKIMSRARRLTNPTQQSEKPFDSAADYPTDLPYWAFNINTATPCAPPDAVLMLNRDSQTGLRPADCHTPATPPRSHRGRCCTTAVRWRPRRPPVPRQRRCCPRPREPRPTCSRRLPLPVAERQPPPPAPASKLRLSEEAPTPTPRPASRTALVTSTRASQTPLCDVITANSKIDPQPADHAVGLHAAIRRTMVLATQPAPATTVP